MRLDVRIKLVLHRIMRKFGWLISWIGFQIEKASRLRFGSGTFYYGIRVMEYWIDRDIKMINEVYYR